MARSKLLIRPKPPGSDGRIHHITPRRAGWTYVGFDVYRLKLGARLSLKVKSRELCIVMVAGKAAFSVDGESFGTIGARLSPFDSAPWSLYAPPGAGVEVKAAGPCEIAVCSAPATGLLPARVIRPEQTGAETRGTGSNTRHVRNILPESEPAEALLVVEVITPGGNWSSYPPHKHDRLRLPGESQLEETYYHRLSRPGGYAVQRVYTDDRSLDETMAVSDGDVVLVPRGYHPVGAPHGYDLYYLNVMAGPKRVWRFHNDPAHEWMLK